MANLNKGLAKAEAMLKWDPSPFGAPDHDLDLVAGAFTAADPYGAPEYLVFFGSRSPDGTITLNRDSTTGKGLGTDEEMTLELDRLSERFTRVVVGVAIQQSDGDLTFGEVANPHIRLVEGYRELAQYDFAGVAGATAARVAEFYRDTWGVWHFRPAVRGFEDTDPRTFGQVLGSA